MDAERAIDVVNTQVEDEGLWFIAQTAPEAYLQQELRRLHAAIEATPAVTETADLDRDRVCAAIVVTNLGEDDGVRNPGDWEDADKFIAAYAALATPAVTETADQSGVVRVELPPEAALRDALHDAFHSGHYASACSQPDRIDLWLGRFLGSLTYRYPVTETADLRAAVERVLAVYDGRRHPDEDPDEEPYSGWDNWHASLDALRAALAGSTDTEEET